MEQKEDQIKNKNNYYKIIYIKAINLLLNEKSFPHIELHCPNVVFITYMLTLHFLTLLDKLLNKLLLCANLFNII